jgi:hypothetical protein
MQATCPRWTIEMRFRFASEGDPAENAPVPGAQDKRRRDQCNSGAKIPSNYVHRVGQSVSAYSQLVQTDSKKGLADLYTLLAAL